MTKRLNVQQQLFIEHLASRPECQTDAARKAGYKNPRQDAVRLLKLPHIQEQLRALTSEDKGRRIATAVERQEFWTRVMYGEVQNGVDKNGEPVYPTMTERLKASELLGKSQADFVERIDLKKTTDITKEDESQTMEWISEIINKREHINVH